MPNPNLLRMTSTPIKIEINVTRASLESPGKKLPKMNVRTNKGGYRMESTPARIKVDTYEARSSLGLGHLEMGDFTRGEAQRGIKLAYQGTARIVEEGNEIAKGSTPVDVAVKNHKAKHTVETIMDFIPKAGPDISFDKGTLNINYELDDVNVDWDHLEASRLVFNPGSVEIVVTQHPNVIIEYVGEPLYFPPSANPDYEPIFDEKF